MRVELSKGHWAEVKEATVRTWRDQQRDGVSGDQADVTLDLARRCITEWSRGDVTLDALDDMSLSDFNKIMTAVNGDESPLGVMPARSTEPAIIHGNIDSGSSVKPASRVRSGKQ